MFPLMLSHIEEYLSLINVDLLFSIRRFLVSVLKSATVVDDEPREAALLATHSSVSSGTIVSCIEVTVTVNITFCPARSDCE